MVKFNYNWENHLKFIFYHYFALHSKNGYIGLYTSDIFFSLTAFAKKGVVSWSVKSCTMIKRNRQFKRS
jgi:hypothetical protein